ncbi:hypothetical protein [Cribrihabitans neustonicus]|uniref:hypothetical protein n=1 Tax=Cribrihabitans neustonicus TaxID=1429085 RepID=UPI003B59EE0E
MRHLVRLAMLCLSLALLGGVTLHDVSGARMSIDMAASSVEQQDDLCSACVQEDGAEIACDFDCTAPLLSTPSSMAELPIAVIAISLVWPADSAVRTRNLDFDPAPPRTTILS